MTGRALPAWIRRQFEADPERMLPYAGHVERQIVMLMGGGILGMLRLHGLPFELEAASIRNARTDRINTLFRSLSDPDLEICLHLVRHHGIADEPQPVAEGKFVSSLMADYRRVALSGMYRNDWFISVLVHPSSGGRRLRDKVSGLLHPGRIQPLNMDGRRRQRLEDVMYMVCSTLSDYGPERLGVQEVATDTDGETLPITEIGTALHLIRTAILQPIPHTTGTLAAAIYTEPATFAPLHFDLHKPGIPRFGSMVGFNNYPGRCRVGMFNKLLSTPYPIVMSHSFRFRSTGSAVTALGFVRQQMVNSGDTADDLAKGLSDAMNATSSLKVGSGRHHFQLAVYASNLADLDSNVADAQQKLSQFGGAAPVREMNIWYNGAQETSYYLQMPGCRAFKPRPGDISTRDLACMASLDNYPEGERSGYWGRSPIRFRTNGGTAYDFITHDEDVGHGLIIGRIGSGKTVLLGGIAACLEPVMGEDGIRLLIDKDEANRLLVEACGGQYRRLLRNKASGLAPLVAFSDSPATRAFFHGLYTWLIVRDGRGNLTNDEDGRLMRGVARQLQMPPHKRSMGGVREFLGYSDPENGAGARFEKYCAGGSMGWLLDNREHVITVGPGFYGFDFTDLIPREGSEDDGACTAAASVIMHQLAGLMDGRRIAAFMDECRFYLEPLRRMIDDYTLTGRKKELMCWLVAQQPEHFTDSAMGMSLVSQMRTKIVFPDASMNVEGLRKMKLSEAAIKQLREDMTLGNARRFLLWRPSAPAICEFDLSALPQLPILSGRPGTIRLMERTRTDNPNISPAEVLDEFYRRLENTRKAA